MEGREKQVTRVQENGKETSGRVERERGCIWDGR